MNDQDNNVKYDETWLHRYQQKKLSSEELEEYELYLLDHPEHVEEVELEESFTDALNFERMKNKYEEIMERKREVKKKLIVSNLMTLAACFLLVVLVQFWTTDKDTVGSAKLVYLESYRSVASEQSVTQIALAGGHESLILVIPSSNGESGAKSRIELINMDTGVGLGEKELKANTDGEFVMVLSNAHLVTGQYELVQKDEHGQKLSGRRLVIIRQ